MKITDPEEKRMVANKLHELAEELMRDGVEITNWNSGFCKGEQEILHGANGDVESAPTRSNWLELEWLENKQKGD